MTQSPSLPLALDERGLAEQLEKLAEDQIEDNLLYIQAADNLMLEAAAALRRQAEQIDAISAVPASRAVKALEWVQNWPSDPNSQWVLVEEIDRSYTIDPESNVFHVTTSQFPSGEYGRDDMGLHPTLEAAKAAAQADFEARIRSALIAQEPAEGAAPDYAALLRDVRKHVLAAWQIWIADDADAIPAADSAVGKLIARIDAALSDSPAPAEPEASPDPDYLREDRIERQRLEREFPDEQ